MANTVLLVEDHEMVREGLLSLLQRQPELQVVAVAADGREAVRLARELTPDIVLMDLGLPHLNGIEATRQVLADSPKTRVIILTVRLDQASLEEALRAGASGYLLKECSFSELQNAIRTVISGRSYLSPQVSNAVIGACFGTRATTELPSLSSREREVLQLVAEGLSTKEIASVLHVSAKTVDTHRTRIMSRLNLHNVAQLTRYAVREGLAGLNP